MRVLVKGRGRGEYPEESTLEMYRIDAGGEAAGRM